MSESQEKRYVLGIDVGTGSARAGVFDLAGWRLGHGTVPTETFRPRPDFHEQSSENIWSACRRAVGDALESAGVRADEIAGIGLDATSCSLVVIDRDDRPVSVSPRGDDYWNVILWMDHRAVEEAAAADATGHDVLRYVGGTMSPEMAPAKLLWLKRNAPAAWSRAARFMDLVDYLVYRMTGNDVRSTCTTVCKWTYQAHPDSPHRGWARDFFASLGLDELFRGQRQGVDIRPVGSLAGGLARSAAEDFGLEPGTPVAVGIIDAHAGGLGMLGASIDGDIDGHRALADSLRAEAALERSLAIIGGTSSCHMAVSRKPIFLDGIWGPYYSAMVPELWLTEGGQSATGSLIDHVIEDSAYAPALRHESESAGVTVYEYLNQRLELLASERGVPIAELTRDLHVLPYFLGNRSPRADASLRGVVSGLGLDASLGALAVRYLAAIQGVALGTRHIIESLNAGGYAIDRVFVCGGGTKNPVWLSQHADITGCQLHLPEEPEAVLLGAAMLGAVASGGHDSVLSAMMAMGRSSEAVAPNRQARGFHDRKYAVFMKMYEHFQELRGIMSDGQVRRGDPEACG